MKGLIGNTLPSGERLTQLLEHLLKQINDYAKELNALDGGNRKEYIGVEDWIKNGPSY